ncbi:hypothetical protein MRX96_040052 [Rhipicephalus microplus]
MQSSGLLTMAGSRARNFSSTPSVEKKVAAPGKVLHGIVTEQPTRSEEVYDRTPSAMARKSPWDPLAILLDLSGNWSIRLWFQVNVRLSAFRVGSSEPVPKIVP